MHGNETTRDVFHVSVRNYQKLNGSSHPDHAIPVPIFLWELRWKEAGGGTTLGSFLAGATEEDDDGKI
jgi:hypothetical protein